MGTFRPEFRRQRPLAVLLKDNMKIKTAIILAVAFAAVAAVTSVSSQSHQRQTPSTTSKAVILGLRTHYRPVTNEWGWLSVEDGQEVQYATVSSNAPAITDGMNAADAIAIVHGAGMKLTFGQFGYYIFVGD